MGCSQTLLGSAAALVLATASAVADAGVSPSIASTAGVSRSVSTVQGEDGRLGGGAENDIAELHATQSRALAASLVGTLAPIAVGVGMAVASNSDGNDTAGLLLVGGGLIFGPFVGYAAGGCGDRGATGVLIRVVTVCGGALLAAAVASNSGGGFLEIDPAPFIVGGAAAALVLLEDVYDIACVRGAVRKAWQEKRQNAALRVAPWANPAEGTIGVGLQLSFMD